MELDFVEIQDPVPVGVRVQTPDRGAEIVEITDRGGSALGAVELRDAVVLEPESGRKLEPVDPHIVGLRGVILADRYADELGRRERAHHGGVRSRSGAVAVERQDAFRAAEEDDAAADFHGHRGGVGGPRGFHEGVDPDDIGGTVEGDIDHAAFARFHRLRAARDVRSLDGGHPFGHRPGAACTLSVQVAGSETGRLAGFESGHVREGLDGDRDAGRGRDEGDPAELYAPTTAVTSHRRLLMRIRRGIGHGFVPSRTGRHYRQRWRRCTITILVPADRGPRSPQAAGRSGPARLPNRASPASAR